MVVEVECVLKICELCSVFVFNKVIVKKFYEFMRVYFDVDFFAGVVVVKFGWVFYVCVKCEFLLMFLDLYLCYYLFVVVEVFLLINVSRESLRTSLKNMVSMTVKDEMMKFLDLFVSFSLVLKVKKDIVCVMLDVVFKVVKVLFLEVMMDVSKYFDDVASSDMCV